MSVLRYSGLRIGDAVQLRRESFGRNRIRIRSLKTGSPVFVPLSESVIAELEAIDKYHGYYFWSGEGLAKSCVADWQRSLARLLKLAGVKGSAHRFRHTFATELLQKGVSTEIVTKLLSHENIRLTQRHYSHWIAERQAEVEEAVLKAWKL